MQNRRKCAALNAVMQTDFHVVNNGHLAEQTNVLEGAGDTQLIDLCGRHALCVNALQKNGTSGRLINVGQEVENRCFAGTVRTDQSGNFRLADGKRKFINRSQTAEVDTQITDIKNRLFSKVTFRNDNIVGDRNHFGGIPLTHFDAASFLLKMPFIFFEIEILNCWKRAFEPRTITRISTSA